MIISQTPLRISFAGGGTDFSRYYREHEAPWSARLSISTCT